MDKSSGTFIAFNDFFKALSSKKVNKTPKGDLNISGTIISSKDFNNLYMNNITSMLNKYESTISPEFTPGKDLYKTLDILSSPVLSETKVPETVNGFYKKLNLAISSKTQHIKKFENSLKDYVETADEIPVFMLIGMSNELKNKKLDNSIFSKSIPDSTTLMNGYGTKYDGDDILYFSNSGAIEPAEPINMLVYKSLHAQDENSNDYKKPVSYEKLLEFYSPEHHPGRMHSLLINGQINKNFSDLHSEILENVSSQERKNYIEDLIDESKKLASTTEDYSNDLLNYSENKIIPEKYLSKNISPEFLKQKFIIGAISLSRILDIYESDTKYFKPLEELLTNIEIEKAHSNNEIEDEKLMYLSQEDRLSYLKSDKTKLSTIMYLFLHCDGISVTELKKILSNNNIVESLDFYIDEGANLSRIKELYENYLIDYGCIKNLISSGIIPEKDAQIYKISISKDSVYDKIQNSKSIEINSNSFNVPISSTGTFINTQSGMKKSMEKTADLYKILGNISEDNSINTPTITSKENKEHNTFFSDYKIIPLKSAGLVTFTPEEPIKSTYIMPYQEAAYILNNKALPYSILENPAFQEIKPSEIMHEDILKSAYQFEESKNYLEKLGYEKSLSFDDNMKVMTKEYIKIKTKGEN